MRAVVETRSSTSHEYLRLARFLGIRHRAHPRDAQPRRPRLGPRAACLGDRRRPIHVVPRGERPTYDHERRSTTAGSCELGERHRCARSHTPGHRPEHTAVRADRLRSAERASRGRVLTGDSLVRRATSRRPDLARRTRPRAPAHLPLDEACALPSRRRPSSSVRTCAGLAGPPRRLALRRARHGPEGLVHDRLRAREPAAAPGDRRGRLRAPATAALQVRSRRTSRTSSRSTAARSSTDTVGRASAHAAPGGAGASGRARSSSTCARELQFDEAHIPAAVCITAPARRFGSRLAWLAPTARSRRRTTCRT